MNMYKLTIKSEDAPTFKVACLHNNALIQSIWRRPNSNMSDVIVMAYNPSDLFYIGLDFEAFKKGVVNA